MQRSAPPARRPQTLPESSTTKPPKATSVAAKSVFQQATDPFSRRTQARSRSAWICATLPVTAMSGGRHLARFVADRLGEVSPPAADRAALQQSAGASLPGGDLGHLAADVDVGGRHLAGLVADVLEVAVAKRADATRAPAADRPADQERAGVVVARGDLEDHAAERDVGGRHLAGRVAEGLRRSVAEDTGLGFVLSPAADRAGVREGAHVRHAGDEARRLVGEGVPAVGSDSRRQDRRCRRRIARRRGGGGRRHRSRPGRASCTRRRRGLASPRSHSSPHS
jgi:hypothetical protein